jgi:uncharacterized protein YpmB|tara:strand:- start:684 stop:902 length:219 start_codon:yes stop_codon:yes gene_type:complete
MNNKDLIFLVILAVIIITAIFFIFRVDNPQMQGLTDNQEEVSVEEDLNQVIEDFSKQEEALTKLTFKFKYIL